MSQRAYYMLYIPKGHATGMMCWGRRCTTAYDALVMYMDDDAITDGGLHMDKFRLAPYSGALSSLLNGVIKPVVGQDGTLNALRYIRQRFYNETGIWMQIRRVNEYLRIVSSKQY